MNQRDDYGHGPAGLRKQVLREKMEADRVRLVAGSRLGAPPRRLATDPDKLAATAQQIGPFLVDHGLAIAAALLALTVLGPRKALMAAVRTASPLLLGRGVRALLAREHR
jgi:hypothetical protein